MNLLRNWGVFKGLNQFVSLNEGFRDLPIVMIVSNNKVTITCPYLGDGPFLL